MVLFGIRDYEYYVGSLRSIYYFVSVLQNPEEDIEHIFLYDLRSLHSCYNNSTFNQSLLGTLPIFT